MDTPAVLEAQEPSEPPEVTPVGEEERPGSSPFPIVGVGASAGGLEAFTQLLTNLPVDTGMAFVLVQHLDPRHESQLVDILARTTRMPVSEAVDGMAVRPDHVYVIPPNTTMALAQSQLTLTPRGETPGLHLPVDIFFRSLANDQRARAIGVILSGSGADGAVGLAEIRAVGGITFAQDEASAPHASMPHSAIVGGSVDFVLPPAEIAQELARIGCHPYLAPSTPESPPLPVASDEQFRKIIALIRAASGVDFTHYRDTTIKRRIMRRLALHPTDTPSEYVRRLETDRSEIEALYQDLLINVTSFFRDPEMFEALKSAVFPAIMKSKAPGAPLRVWVSGCSTGQEAYSLAIALLEFLDDQPASPSIQIFASDLDDTVSLACARAGLYSESIAAEVSPDRLRRFFTPEEGGYRINQSVRELCVFARQNVAADPPFSRVDLISCRNVLIYMAPPLQRRVIPTFHYALNATGFLVLGAAETVGAFTPLFEEVDRTHKIYSRKASVGRQYPHFSAEATAAAIGAAAGARSPGPSLPAAADFQREADRIALGRYAPVGVLVNDQLEILQFRGRTNLYLEPAPGEASLNLLKMAREGLLVPLKSAVDEARMRGEAIRRPGVRVRDAEQPRDVDLVVIPVRLPSAGAGCFLILFEAEDARETANAPGDVATARAAPADEGDVAQLRTELAAAREYLQSIIEQQDAANEELRSASEEILSSNEELQSTNEELQTTKEELQSVNEELATVNDQLEYRNRELTQLYNDVTNLLGSAGIPLLMLGSDLCIRRFTAAAGKLLNLLATDVGRPLLHLAPTLDVPDLEALLLEVIESVQVVEREVRDREGRWHALRIHPYRTADNKIDGAVIVLLDIDAVKRAQEQLREARDYAQAIVDTVREPLIILGSERRVITANQSFYETFQVSRPETEGQRLDELGNGQWDLPELRTRLDEVLSQSSTFEAFMVERDFPGIGVRSMRLNARLLRQEENQSPLILVAIEDVTERQRAEWLVAEQSEALREADRRKDSFLAMLAHELRNPLGPIRNAAQLLKRQGEEAPHVRRAREIIERQVNHQARLLDDLLDVTRITQGKILLQFEPVDLAQLVLNTAEDHRGVLEAAGLTLSLALPEEALWVQGDATRLAQAMGNLLQNTAKFTDRGGHVTVRLAVESAVELNPKREKPVQSSWAVVTVCDTGMGIEPEVLPHVFEMFAQADRSLDRNRSGLGLGLAMVKGLVELHGGEVRAESEGLGHGSEFSLVLPGLAPLRSAVPAHPGATADVFPAAAPATDEVGTASLRAQGPRGRPLRVLIVEDNRDAAETLRDVLELSGYTVAVTYSGSDAVQAAQEFQPEVVLCDLGLPGMDGYQVAAALRQNPATASTPLIAMSGYGQEEDRRHSEAAGFGQHLVKPVDLAQLERLLAEAAGTRSTELPAGE